MQSVRQVVHSALLPGEPLPEGARRPAQLRLQRAALEDVRVRGVRPHDGGARGPLHPPQGLPPLQSGATQVLR